MTTLVATSFLPDMMARHRLQDHTDDGSARYMDVPLRDQYSEPLWLPQTVGGPQNFHAPKGYHQNPQSGVRSRTSQNGTPPGLDDSPFYGNISHQWNQTTPPYTMDEMAPLYSKTSLETMVSNTDLTSGSDHPGTLDSSYSVSSDHLDTLDCSSSLSDTGLYTDNTNFVKNEFSELQFLDEEETRTGAFHTGLSNGDHRSPSHMVPIANGSPSHIFAMGTDESIYTTGSEIMPHSVVTSGAHTGDYNPEFSWMSGDHTGPKVSSPTYSISGLSIPMSRRSSALDALPAFNGQSPRSSRKSMVPNNRIDEDSYPKFGAEPLEFLEDRFSDRGRRNGETSEMDNVARDHPYYHSAVLGPDRLYHCPWESMNPPCNHKPEKLKCNYDKCVDSHLKPYRCKVQSCGETRFSSTACLLRHEREAHAMHGHGEKPFLCTAENCDRAILGNGFPRHWNLRDHMKRVHNTVPEPTDSDQPTRLPRKRKTSSVDGKMRKKNSASSPPKDIPAPQPVNNEPSPEDQFREHRRQLMSAMELLNDPSDPEALAKLRRANTYLKEMAATSQKLARTNSPTG
ncbi:hypothetical protein V499_03911 [Pseudogymnoascus sp. VKM F-103]|uniref:C2H2-type domain-containing protein n=1 Tax=Pseudogymnoascus verrucosus TaxID=342668 RepID=A0A1B8GDX8_9PEZI|nr:uncharacterized protein VE01_07098 [Pseudogymnoascus verrucosus]KFY76489.1 hypothetical protein V499_03911 [Pseudogymnoascus sp. VKM F-103]OBT94035.2 hypothetical protein VE01_07098 [Pseudogymnoascus verrucosus]